MVERPVYYVHIPKTAGTSIRTLLKRVKGDRRFVEFPLRREERAAAALQLGPRDVVVGHVGYGLVERFPVRPFVFTFLRDPIERSLSNFSFLQQRTMDPTVAEDAADFVAAKGLTLAEFIQREPAAASRHVGNLAVWFLTRDGIEGRGDLRTLDRRDLEAAKANLERLGVVGLAERMTESVAWLLAGLGASPAAIRPLPFENVLTSRLRSDQLDERTAHLLSQTCSLDLELYRFAVDLFETRVGESLPEITRWVADGSDRSRPSRNGFLAMLELVREESDQRVAHLGRTHEDELNGLRQRIEEAEQHSAKATERLRVIEGSKGWWLVQSLRGLVGRRW